MTYCASCGRPVHIALSIGVSFCPCGGRDSDFGCGWGCDDAVVARDSCCGEWDGSLGFWSEDGEDERHHDVGGPSEYQRV